MTKIRRIGASLCVVAVLIGLGWGILWLSGWDGSYENRSLVAGDEVVLANGLSLTIPTGYEGSISRYRQVPQWVPFRSARFDQPFREILRVRRTDAQTDPESLVQAFTYWTAATPPVLNGRREVTRSNDVAVYDSVEETGPVVAATSRPGFARGYLIVKNQGDSIDAVRRMWALLNVQGAESP